MVANTRFLLVGAKLQQMPAACCGLPSSKLGLKKPARGPAMVGSGRAPLPLTTGWP